MTSESFRKNQSLLKKLEYLVTTVTYAGILFVKQIQSMNQEADSYPVPINVFLGKRSLDTRMH